MNRFGYVVAASVLTAVLAGAAAGVAYSRDSGSQVPATSVKIDDLEDVLLMPEAAATALGAPTMTQQKFNDDNSKPRPANPRNRGNPCSGILHSGLSTTYDDSGWSEFVHRQLRDGADRRILNQTAVMFPSARAAAAFVSAQRAVWQTCADSMTNDWILDVEEFFYNIGPVADADGILATTIVREGGEDWSCVRGLAWRVNVVMDIDSCGTDLDPSVLPGLVVPIAQRIEQAASP